VDRGVNDGRVDNRIHANGAYDTADADGAYRAQDRADAADAHRSHRASDGAEWTTDAAVATDAVGVERIPNISPGRRTRHQRSHRHCRYRQHGQR
jgi:hypothetical protein